VLAKTASSTGKKDSAMPVLAQRPIHLAADGLATEEPPYTGPEWFTSYDARHPCDDAGDRLVVQFSFTQSWAIWEVHPFGAEVVLCIAGNLTLIQRHPDGEERRLALGPGDYAINPPGVWHTVDIAEGAEATCVFMTSGRGTEHRPR